MEIPLWLYRTFQFLNLDVSKFTTCFYKGIDVSEWNGTVNFSALQGQIDFAILRCGYGSDYESQDDACFKANVAACRKAGLPYGVYLYSYAKTTQMAESEAEHTLRLIKGTNPRFGIWYDIEDASLIYDDNLANICSTYCDAIKAAGYPCVGIYASDSIMESYLNGSQLASYEKWVAQWNDECEYPNPGMWQFTKCYELEGRQFDMNKAYKDYVKITDDIITQDKFDQMMAVYWSEVEKRGPNDWSKEVWQKATDEEIVDGSAPQAPMTREEAMVVLSRMGLLK